MWRVFFLFLALGFSAPSHSVIADGSSGQMACIFGYEIGDNVDVWCTGWLDGHQQNGFTDTWVDGRNISLADPVCNTSITDPRYGVCSSVVQNYGGGLYREYFCDNGTKIGRAHV